MRTQELGRPGWIAVGNIDDIPLRGARRISRAGGLPAIAVFRTGADDIFALVDRCPHRGGPLSEGIVQGRGVACPLHGWVISLDDGRAEAPDEGCTERIAVNLDGSRILLPAAVFEAGQPAALRWDAA